MRNRIKVAFVCVHNSCRSQMAEVLMKHYGSDIIECFSAGTEVKDKINQDAQRLMNDIYGIDMGKTQYSKLISELPDIDILITMGCNVVCPSIPSKLRMDWGLDDPSGKDDIEFIKVIETIDNKVHDLIAKIESNYYNIN